jgi:hypothetical protein
MLSTPGNPVERLIPDYVTGDDPLAEQREREITTTVEESIQPL